MKKVLAVAISLILTHSAWAEKMSIETHDILIQKIEAGYDKKSTIVDSVDLRLADLYADRARLKSMKEAELSCNNCRNSKNDRAKALKKYLRLFEILKGDEQERVLAQVIQMNQLMDNHFAKEKFYKKIVREKRYGSKLKARAYLALGEMSFQKGQFAVARKLYKNAVGLKRDLGGEKVRFRLAWCAYNLGEFESAKSQLVAILRNTTRMKKYPTLHSEISKDLGTFFAKRPVGIQQIKELHRLSPSGEAKGNLTAFADELSRLGQPASTTLVSQYVLDNFQADSIEKSQMAIQMAQAQYNLNQKIKASESYSSAMSFYKKSSCKESSEACQGVGEQSRKMLIHWRQDEKLNPSPRLVSVFSSYLSTFSKDSEIAFWGGQAAEAVQKWRTSQNFYQQAAKVLAKDTSAKKRALFENSALSAIRVAETSKNANQRREAYKLYLTLLPAGQKAFEARYQLAYVDYEEKKYSAAKKGFSQLVADFNKQKKSAHKSFAKKSADLILDILALENNDEAIMDRSLAFGAIFKSDSKEYNGIYRKAVYNQAVGALKTGQVPAMKASLEKMKRVSFRNVVVAEQIQLLETQSTLAEKLKDIVEVNRSAAKLLTYKSLSKKSRTFANQQLIWAAEVSMNFSRAYTLSLRTMSGNKSKKDLLRLALLADLSGKSPNKHYEAYLKKGCGVLECNQVRAKIVKASRAPWKAIQKYFSKLKGSPQMFSELALETYMKHGNRRGAERVLSESSAYKKPAGKTLRRHLEIPKFKSLAQELGRHRISTASDRRTQTSTGKRMELVDQLTAMANKAIDRQDIPLQLAALTVLEKENRRLHGELIALPTPSGLSAQEKTQYLNLLNTQAAPFLKKSQEIASNLGTLWASESYVAGLKADYQDSSLLARTVIAKEAEFLADFAPEGKKKTLMELSRGPKIAGQELAFAQEKAQKNPFSIDNMNTLKKVAEYYGKAPHMAYADQRIQQLKGNP